MLGFPKGRSNEKSKMSRDMPLYFLKNRFVGHTKTRVEPETKELTPLKIKANQMRAGISKEWSQLFIGEKQRIQDAGPDDDL